LLGENETYHYKYHDVFSNFEFFENRVILFVRQIQ